MNGQVANLENVTDAILLEILGVMGLAQNRLSHWPVRSLFGPPARRMARLLVQLDQDIASNGLRAAAKSLLARFVQDIKVENPGCLPKDGPLLVVSNHPGAYDLLMLVATITREDLKIISSDLTFIRHLPSVAPYLITITDDPYRRMVCIRSAIRHLQEGKALLVFARGEIEPDPALSEDAIKGIDLWSLSLDLFPREVPQICSVVTMVSGVFSSRWFNHPILRVWKKPEQRQKIAQIIQVAEQLVLSRKSQLEPRVSFSTPLTFSGASEKAAPPGWWMNTLTETARAQVAAITR